MIRYLADDYYRSTIDRIKIDRETDSSFWINNRSHRKETNKSKLFDNFDSAKEWLVNRHETAEKISAGRLRRAQDNLADALRLTESP